MKKIKKKDFFKKEDKNEKQLKTIENKENKQLGIMSGINIFDEDLSRKAKELFKEIYYWKLWTPAEDMQKQFASVLTALEKYKPKKPKYIDKKSKL